MGEACTDAADAMINENNLNLGGGKQDLGILFPYLADEEGLLTDKT